MSPVAFSIVAALAIASALGLITRRNAIHGALLLVVNLACVAVLFLGLGAQFLAAAQVIIYAGAIMVLFVFAIMVLIPGKADTGPDPRRRWRVAALPLGAVLLAQLALVVTGSRGDPAARGPEAVGSAADIGRVLFGQYLFPFELTAVLLLAAMIGVLVLARRAA